MSLGYLHWHCKVSFCLLDLNYEKYFNAFCDFLPKFTNTNFLYWFLHCIIRYHKSSWIILIVNHIQMSCNSIITPIIHSRFNYNIYRKFEGILEILWIFLLGCLFFWQTIYLFLYQLECLISNLYYNSQCLSVLLSLSLSVRSL